MALQISEFTAFPTNNYGPAGIAGKPAKVTNAATSIVLDATTRLIRISGSGAITWPGIANAERFDGTEYRTVAGGETLAVSA